MPKKKFYFHYFFKLKWIRIHDLQKEHVLKQIIKHLPDIKIHKIDLETRLSNLQQEASRSHIQEYLDVLTEAQRRLRQQCN